MAIIKPFHCVRPAADKAKAVAALPYDVYNREEARAVVAGAPLSFLNIDRPETQFAPDADMYAPEVYAKASEMLESQIADGVYETEPVPCFFVYEETMDGRTQTGLVACSSVDDYVNNIIRKHENTREEKEQDRIRHVDVCSAQTGPIFLAYREQPRVTAYINAAKQAAPLYDFVSDDGIRHEVWRIADPGIVKGIEAAFKEIPNTYIADGHHRAASAVKVALKRRAAHPDAPAEAEFNYFLSVLFPDEQLKILPYNRVVKDLKGMDADTFIRTIAEKFDVEPAESAVSPEVKGTYGMYLEGKWYKLTAHEDILSDDPVEGLDVSVLQNELLAPILGIGDPRTDKRIDFIGGIRGLGELERRANSDMKVAFSMYPTSIAELFAVADAGLLMPPKSTWFEPKLRSGLFIHRIER